MEEFDRQLLTFILKDKIDEGVINFNDLFIIDVNYSSYKKEDVIVSCNKIYKYILRENELEFISSITNNLKFNNHDRVLIMSFMKEENQLMKPFNQYFLKFEYIDMLKENTKIDVIKKEWKDMNVDERQKYINNEKDCEYKFLVMSEEEKIFYYPHFYDIYHPECKSVYSWGDGHAIYNKCKICDDGTRFKWCICNKQECIEKINNSSHNPSHEEYILDNVDSFVSI
jgi:hypothetical protein